MSKIAIYHLSQFIKIEPMKTIAAFEAMGVNKYAMLFSLWWPWSGLNTAIESYRLGHIDTETFKKEVGVLFPQTENHPDFEAAWNAMCDVSDNTILHAIDAQLENNTQVYLISSTNPLHFEHIQQAYGEKREGITAIVSYEEQVTGKNLVSAVLNQIHETHPQIPNHEIEIFYQPVPDLPYPNLGVLNWLIAPVETWFHHQKEQYISAIESITSQEGINFTAYIPEVSDIGCIELAETVQEHYGIAPAIEEQAYIAPIIQEHF